MNNNAWVPFGLRHESLIRRWSLGIRHSYKTSSLSARASAANRRAETFLHAVRPRASISATSKMVREAQRPAAQRRETGSENHSVIRVLRRGHHLFLEATRRFVAPSGKRVVGPGQLSPGALTRLTRARRRLNALATTAIRRAIR